MKKIEIFDPAMCCPTGLCGTNINPELMRIAVVVETLKRQGVIVIRHNLRDEPQVYVSNKTNTENTFLQAKAQNEVNWIEKVEQLSKGNAALIGWKNI